MHLYEIQETAWNINEDNGFHEKERNNPSYWVAGLHSEVSEFWEASRNDTLNKKCDKCDKLHEIGIDSMTCAEEELADIVIRVADISAQLGINLDKCVYQKLELNKSRGYLHGKKNG